MRSHATPRFWRLFRGLPAEVRRLAVKAYHLWQENPSHPSLRYRRLEGRENLVTVRGEHYRALDLLEAGVVEWIWIGAHARRGAPSVPRYVPETGRTSSTSRWSSIVTVVTGISRFPWSMVTSVAIAAPSAAADSFNAIRLTAPLASIAPSQAPSDSFDNALPGGGTFTFASPIRVS